MGCLNSGLFTALGGKTNSALICMIQMSADRQTDRHFPSSLPVEPAFVCAAPQPPLSRCDYSFFKEQTSPWWDEFINKFGFDCMHRGAHHELICIHTSALVDVPTTR